MGTAARVRGFGDDAVSLCLERGGVAEREIERAGVPRDRLVPAAA